MNNKLLEYFKGDELAASVWESKYATEGEETPDDMHIRMAKEFARIEEKYKDGALGEKEIYDLFKDFKYIIPQGSVMAVLGTDQVASLSNCVVIDSPDDSYGGIMKSDEELAQLYKRRCGVGLDISTLRPSGTPTTNSAKSSTGAASFMERFSNTTREVSQNGRRGANMLTMDVKHPDIEEFVEKKQDLSKVTGANISVRISDEFMRAVENDEAFHLAFPIEREESAKIYKAIRARDLWHKIVKCAHNTAEPGLIFWDRQNDYSPSTVYPGFENMSTNPCSEIAMGAYDTCRLIAINLFSFINDPFTDEASFDHEKFSEVVRKAMRLSDDLVDLEIEQIHKILKKIEDDPEDYHTKEREYKLWENILDTAKKGRRTGLGITGLGDALAALGMKYDSDKAKEEVDRIFHNKLGSELKEGIELSKQRGAFPDWDKDTELEEGIEDPETMNYGNSFYMFLWENFQELCEEMREYGRRNISWSTVAPTGSLSLLAGVTSGIEPLYSPYHIRRKKINPSDKNVRTDFIDDSGDHWQEYIVTHSKFLDWIEQTTIDEAGKYVDKSESEFFQYCFEISPYYGSTAPDIDWIDRVEIQGIIQKYTTHSISSTINLPSDISIEKVKEIYTEAWKKGLKGITIYRDGARSGVLLNSKDKDRSFKQNDAPKRPKTLPCDIYHSTIEGEKFVVAVGILEQKPYEVFAYPAANTTVNPSHKEEDMYITKEKKGVFILHKGKDKREVYGNIANVMSEERGAITLLASGMLRHGAKIDFVNKCLRKPYANVTSFVKAINRTLNRYNTEGEESLEECPNDGKGCNIVREEGCLKCTTCGNTKCG